jgi:hypothetical protein
MKLLVRLDGVDVEWVHEPFVPVTRIWNEQLVRASFIPGDAKEVLKIRLGAQMQDDMFAWANERCGVYSVRSCYRRLEEEQDQKTVILENA